MCVAKLIVAKLFNLTREQSLYVCVCLFEGVGGLIALKPFRPKAFLLWCFRVI